MKMSYLAWKVFFLLKKQKYFQFPFFAFIVCLFSFLSDPMHLLQLYFFWAMWLEDTAAKCLDSPPDKTVVKERILQKIDLSKGI